MGQKINPISFRLPINKNWSSRWITKRLFPYMLCIDNVIRQSIYEKIGKNNGMEKIEIERASQELKITIYTSQPGLIIGRAGKGIAELKKSVEQKIDNARELKLINSNISKDEFTKIKQKITKNIKINIAEIRNPEIHAALVAENVAFQLEKRMPYRRVIKQAIEKISNNKTVKGVKISVAGRLGGVDIARKEKFSFGSIPLGTLRSIVDYAYRVAQLPYAGTIGIKVWIYTGQRIK